MKVSRLLLALIIFPLLIVVGCSSFDEGEIGVHSTKNPTAEEVLKLDPDADIFQFNGVMYFSHVLFSSMLFSKIKSRRMAGDSNWNIGGLVAKIGFHGRK